MPKPDVTPAELAVLQVLWQTGARSVRQITDTLYPDGGTPEYGTVQKLLQRLAAKGHVGCDRDASPHRWQAQTPRETLVDTRLQDLVDQVCAGSILPIVSHLARRRLDADERAELRRFVEQLDGAPAKRRRRR